MKNKNKKIQIRNINHQLTIYIKKILKLKWTINENKNNSYKNYI